MRGMIARLTAEARASIRVMRLARANPRANIGWNSRILGDPALSVGEDTEIEDGVILDFRFGGSIVLGRRVKLYSGAILSPFGGSIVLGDDCGVNHYSVLYGHGGLTVGNLVRFAAHCVVIPANHEIADRTQPIHRQPLSAKGIRLADIWVGAQSTILDGVTIGDGAVIGAGSVVTRDVPEYTLVAGAPARALRER